MASAGQGPNGQGGACEPQRAGVRARAVDRSVYQVRAPTYGGVRTLSTARRMHSSTPPPSQPHSSPALPPNSADAAMLMPRHAISPQLRGRLAHRAARLRHDAFDRLERHRPHQHTAHVLPLPNRSPLRNHGHYWRGVLLLVHRPRAADRPTPAHDEEQLQGERRVQAAFGPSLRHQNVHPRLHTLASQCRGGLRRGLQRQCRDECVG